MTKRLICIGKTDFNYSHVEWLFQDRFKFEYFNPSTVYDKDSCIFIMSRDEHWNDLIIDKYLTQGFRLILANPWEARPYVTKHKFEPYLDNILVILGCQNPYDFGWKNVLAVPKWFWYNESLLYTCDDRCYYHTYTPNRTNNKLFLMPMRRSKEFRNRIREKFTDLLDDSIYSYAQAWTDPKNLPRYTHSSIERVFSDRVFEPDWYDDTYFSIAVETAVDRQYDMSKELSNLRTEAYPCDVFVTEKTFKPIAFYHPFMVCGMKGSLKFLHSCGFETYENIFDESYDNLDFFEDRLSIIYNNAKNFNVQEYSSSLTKEKMIHNYNRFYDRAAILTGINEELINPLLEWVNE